MSDYDWTMGLSYGDLQVEYRWRDYIYEGKSVGYYGSLVDLATGEGLLNSSAEEWLVSALKTAAASFRRVEIRSSLDTNSIEFAVNKDHRKRVALELFERSQRGEFLGQASHNELFYVQDLAAILDQPMSTTLELVHELVGEGKLGLNGMILIPFEDQEDAFESLKQSTGHLRLSLGDFGYWGCEACGKFGDEYDNPRDFECSPAAP